MKNRIHLRLEELNKDERKAYMMLTYIALTYRANLTTLSELFKIDPHELHEKLLDYNYSSDSHLRGLEFLFWGDKFNQEKSAEKIMAFYLAWIKLSKIEDKEARDNEKAKLLGIIKSIKGYNALMKLKSGETLTEEEMLDTVEKAILLFREQGQTGERFADTIARIGFEEVERQLLSNEILERKQEILDAKLHLVGGATC